MRSRRNDSRRADLLWNFCCTFRPPFLYLFKHRALIDLDPGMVQIPALDRGYSLDDHDTLLTVGSKIGQPDCRVPTWDVRGTRFLPFVHLPAWKAAPDPGSGRHLARSHNGHGMKIVTRSEYSAYPSAGLTLNICKCRRDAAALLNWRPTFIRGTKPGTANSY